MFNHNKIKARAISALEKEFKSELKSSLSFDLRAGSFSSTAWISQIVFEIKPIQVPEAKLKSCKAFFKKHGKRFDLAYRTYYKARLKYEGKLCVIVGLTKSQALLRVSDGYYIVPHIVAKIAADSFAQRL
tara:strand:+ start:2854 stop:3243 length:390 start_codon:yes stop_codon:yes gene_type:complete